MLREVDRGELQLPEFQRNWTWDDERIVNIIASLTQGYPMGALMQLECGGDFKLKYRAFEGTGDITGDPDNLVLDGQQRLTSLYCSLYAKKPVRTKNIRGLVALLERLHVGEAYRELMCRVEVRVLERYAGGQRVLDIAGFLMSDGSSGQLAAQRWRYMFFECLTEEYSHLASAVGVDV